MKIFGEEVKHTSTNSPLNILRVESFEEIFFGVFEVELNEQKYPLEKISDYKGNPVVQIPIIVEGEEVLYPFVLVKGTSEILFNESNTDLPIEYTVLDIDYQEEEVLSESKQEILEQIEKAKENARKALRKARLTEALQLSEETKKNNTSLKNTLEKARQNLVHEFIEISDKLKRELLKKSITNYSELTETLNNRLTNISEDLESQLESNFENASKIFDSKIQSLVKELYKETVHPKLEKELNDIAFQIIERVESIESNLDDKLKSKAEKTLVEGVSKELSAIQKANIELNDNINKGVNKALSRAGNVKTLVEKIDKEINEKFENELSNIEKYFDERIVNIQEKTFDITEESRKYIIDLVNKSKMDLFEEIKKIPKEKPVEYILESKKKDPEKVNLDKLKKEYDSIIHDKFENYKTDLRKYIAVYSGGGSVAQQFADGGTMNGNLVIVGSISASQYLGIPTFGGGGVSGDYLPLSGGTLTGLLSSKSNVMIDGSVEVDKIIFDQTPESTGGVGQLIWNDTDGTLDLGLKGGNVALQLGQKQVVRVVNKTGNDLLESEYKVVHVAGATGQRLSVNLSLATDDANSANTIGVVTENIAKNQEGFIITMGQIREINTTGSLQGETWQEGDLLYLSSTIAGNITNIKPQAPYHSVLVGYVEYVHANHGKIFVRVQNGNELEELHNVRITSVQNNDILQYNSLSSIWENTNNIKINSLSADRIYTTQLDALSANISVIDIKQYELSGFNVTGDCSIQGSVSASGPLYGSNLIYNMGNTNGSNVLIGTNDNYDLNFETASATRMTILSSGNVGIGTTTPASELTVDGGDIEVVNNLNGVILASPDNSRWRITINNAGALITTKL
jgi:hypothetical protein